MAAYQAQQAGLREHKPEEGTISTFSASSCNPCKSTSYLDVS